MSGTVTFDGAPPAGTIDLGLGQPSADLLRIDLLRQASESIFSEAHPFELNYGVIPGDERFLESLAGYLCEGYDATVSPESLVVTAGNSQALDFVSTVFSKSGDTVFVEEPSYYLAFQIFRDHGLNVVGVPIDDNGMQIDALEALVSRAEGLLEIEVQPGMRWHSPRRELATDHKDGSLKVLCELGGWKSPKTVLECYQQADLESQRGLQVLGFLKDCKSLM